MPKPISKIPVLLFPLKIETRFVKDQLWIRAFPDGAFIQSHDPRLNSEEKLDAKAFKQLNTREQKEQAWEEMVSKYGVYRSSWLVQISSEVLDSQQGNNGVEEKEPSFFLKWLPDRLVFYLYKKGENKPAYTGEGAVINREGLTVLGDGDEWLHDFDRAIKAGMGIKITIDPSDTGFDKIIVSGFRHDDDPLDPAAGLADLFNNHKFTEGFSFLKYGTPTNNTGQVKSGHSARDEFNVNGSYEYAVEGLNLESDPIDPDINTLTAGILLAHALGFETSNLKHVQNADLKPDLLNELYQKASWFALGAPPIFMLFGNQISSEFHETLWRHYAKYVKSKGLFSPLKIGKQPYGVLPVMNISNVFLPENKEILNSEKFMDRITVALAHLLKRWLLMAQGTDSLVPRLQSNDTHEEILRILSMQEASGSYQIRALQYNFFRSTLYQSLQIRPENAFVLNFIEGLNNDLKGVLENVRSLADLLSLDKNELSEELDQFLRAPVLGFTEGNANLLAFQDHNSVVTDQEGNVIATESADDMVVSFTQDDLGSFQDFINALKDQKEGELIQFRGDLSVFTDLFLRSYANACQLYSREVLFDLKIAETSPGSRQFLAGPPLKGEGDTVNKGESVVKIMDSTGKSIEVLAPFEGKVKKLLVRENDSVEPGSPVFIMHNETRFKAVKSAFIKLGQQLIDSVNAIPEGKDRREAQRKAIGEVVDLNSYRLDAWITSLAARRIDEIRRLSDHDKGIYFGAYGWIEDLEKDEHPVNSESLTDIYREAGGIIHTAGVAQAVASSVFKNSYLSHKHEEQSNPFEINLTSDRLQKGQFLMDGIRQGQQLEALLGYQLERHLHEDDLHQEIYQLREAFPLYENTTTENSTGFVNLSVIDGLKAIKNKAEVSDKVLKHIEKLEDTMDACLDTLFYEAGYQVTQGNLVQAAAAIEATRGEIEPPIIESLKTRIPGTGMNHKLIMILQENKDQFTIESPRAFAEPNLENWLKENLGPMNKIACVVELYDLQDNTLTNTLEVSLKDLEIGYLDFLYLSNDPVAAGSSDLELRIRNFVLNKTGTSPEQIKYVITNHDPENGQSLSHALEVARFAKSLLSRSRYLKSDDLTMEKESIKHDRTSLDRIKEKRLQPLINRLGEIVASDLTNRDTLKWLSNLDFESAKTAFLESASIDTDKLKKDIEAKIALAKDLLIKYDSQNLFYQAFELLRKATRALFGDAFILLPPANGSENFTQLINPKDQKFLVGDPNDSDADQVWGQERIHNWVQGMAQVHENTEIFEDWQMVHSVWSQSMGLSPDFQYTVVQGPTLLQYPWVALSKQEIDHLLSKQFASQPVFTDPGSGEAYPLSDGSYYPEGCDSTVVYASKSISLKNPVVGLVIEEVAEHIPDSKTNTGLSFNYNIPNNEPPQAILLAVHPKATQESDFFWSENDLRDILYDTMDLYKIRMVDLEAVQEYGYLLPMTYWFNIPGNK